MILQPLYELAQEELLILDPYYESKPITYLVRLDKDGSFLGFTVTREAPPENEGKKRKATPKSFAVPRCRARTSGDRAFFLYDKAEYVFGMDPDGKRPTDKLEQRAALFQEGVDLCSDAISDPGVDAVARFLKDLRTGRQTIELPEDCATNDLFAFVVEPKPRSVSYRQPAVRISWKAQRATADDSEKAWCLVLGREAPVAELFPGLKKLPGGSTSGVALVSFNKPAFESYGLKGNQNATVSREAAETCATALNRLLDTAYPHPTRSGETLPKRRIQISGDSVVVFWAKGEGDVACDIFGGLLEGDPAQVREVYRSIWRGKAPHLDDASAFYALTLTGTQGRAIVRDWFESTVSEVMDQVAAYFEDIDIVRNTPKPKQGDLPPAFPIGRLMESLAVQGKREEIPAQLAAQFVHAALNGGPFPFAVLTRAVERMRAEIGKMDWPDVARRDARAALIKAVLNRRGTNKEIQKAMDKENKNAGYLLGRLMAVLERMQQLALGSVNASVVDRFFAGASATPIAVFPRLLKNMRNHAAKAKGDNAKAGAATWLEKEVDTIMADVNSIPAHLPIEQQGLFVIGYHHERHWLWTKKEDRENEA